MFQRHGCHLLFFLISFGILLGQFAFAAPQAEVRVRLQKHLYQSEITGFALRVIPPSGYLTAATEVAPLNKIRIRLVRPGVWSVRWSKDRVQIIEGNRLYVRGQMLRLGLEPVPSDLVLVENNKQGFDVVSHMEIESYLAGVLPSEMPLSWPLEALKAQAVAARSYALRTTYERRNLHFDVEATVLDQVYKFWTEEAMRPDWQEKVRLALLQTRGEIMTDERGRVLKAFYHADCGCQTEDPKYVWGASSSFQSVRDPTCERRKTFQWNLSLVDSEVQEKMVQHFSLPHFSKLRDLSIVSRTPSGRVAFLAANFGAQGQRNASYSISAQNFRKLFGFKRVLSSNFTLRKGADRLQLAGQGLGHGVGLCQWGARAMASEGSTYLAILKNFYPRAKFRSPRTI